MKPNDTTFRNVAVGASLMLTACADERPVAPDVATGPSFNRNAPAYTFTSIEVPGARATSPQGINSAGHVVGGFTDANGQQHGFLLRDGVFTQIDVPGAGRTAARGIGPDGDIVGTYAPAGSAAVVSFGFRRSAEGELTFLSFPGYLHTIPQRILPDGTWLGCAHNNDTMDSMVGVDVGNRGSNAISAFASMTNGATSGLKRMVGLYVNMDTERGEGFIIEDGVLTSLAVPGSLFTAAWDMNPRGDIVGVFQDAAGAHGFVLTTSGYTTINYPGATATRVFGVNARGDLVGTYVLGNRTIGFLAQRI